MLNRVAIFFLQIRLWNEITHKGWYTIKQRDQINALSVTHTINGFIVTIIIIYIGLCVLCCYSIEHSFQTKSFLICYSNLILYIYIYIYIYIYVCVCVCVFVCVWFKGCIPKKFSPDKNWLPQILGNMFKVIFIHQKEIRIIPHIAVYLQRRNGYIYITYSMVFSGGFVFRSRRKICFPEVHTRFTWVAWELRDDRKDLDFVLFLAAFNLDSSPKGINIFC